MIPLPDITRAIQVPVGDFYHRRSDYDVVRVGSYDPSDSMSSRNGDGEFSEDSGIWKLPMSLPSNGLDKLAARNFPFGAKKSPHDGTSKFRVFVFLFCIKLFMLLLYLLLLYYLPLHFCCSCFIFVGKC